MKTKILFVDDDTNVLQGLRRMLHSMRDQWDMSFANSGGEALELMAEEVRDVVISDIRMPEMDGVELLTRVRDQYPSALRIALSGETGKELGYKTAKVVNQCLSKPIETEALKLAIERAGAVKKHLDNEDIKGKISQLVDLPSLPDSYTKIRNVLESPSASMKDVANILSEDMAMTAKILQLANSAFFGVGRKITSIKQAVTMLGIALVSDLVLSVHLFGAYDKTSCPGFSIDDLWKESLEVASLASAIATQEKQAQTVIDGSFLTGILHNVGKLILAINFPKDYRNAIVMARREKILDWEAEKKVLGATHADVGAYLGGIWGFPHPVVEGIACYICPARAKAGGEFCPMTAVHGSVGLRHKAKTGKDDRIDKEYLLETGLLGRIHSWEAILQGKK
jgi:HD-like signal output (HDOD) protein